MWVVHSSCPRLLSVSASPLKSIIYRAITEVHVECAASTIPRYCSHRPIPLSESLKRPPVRNLARVRTPPGDRGLEFCSPARKPTFSESSSTRIASVAEFFSFNWSSDPSVRAIFRLTPRCKRSPFWAYRRKAQDSRLPKRRMSPKGPPAS